MSEATRVCWKLVELVSQPVLRSQSQSSIGAYLRISLRLAAMVACGTFLSVLTKSSPAMTLASGMCTHSSLYGMVSEKARVCVKWKSSRKTTGMQP